MDLRCKNGCASINHAKYFEKHKKVKPQFAQENFEPLQKMCCPQISKNWQSVHPSKEATRTEIIPTNLTLAEKIRYSRKTLLKNFRNPCRTYGKKNWANKKNNNTKTSPRENAIHKIQPTATLIQLSAPQFVFPDS